MSPCHLPDHAVRRPITSASADELPAGAHRPCRLLGLSGSLRQCSINTALLRVLAEMLPAELQLRVQPGLGDLPLFNPDLEDAPPAAVVASFVLSTYVRSKASL
jgi:hypothetical protein